MIIKTGLMGTLGNKGSCLIRFNYMDTSFAFSCGHFAAGSSANNNRLNELNDILNKNFPVFKELKFRDHDVAIISGDLNFRNEIEYSSCLQLIKNKNLINLAEYDQFNRLKKVNLSLVDIEEGSLCFNPTYKYNIGTNEYDAKRKRVPSWCDRIFFKKSRLINQLIYDRAEYTHSDHRPVFSIFNISAYQEIKETKKKIIQEIRHNLILDIKPTKNLYFQKSIEEITQQTNRVTYDYIEILKYFK
jgi:hypothetical protein